MNDAINVGLGEMAVSKDPDDVLVAYGLGSCLGISMYDPVNQVSGLLHAVLPENSNGISPSALKFVDSGIEGLLESMIKKGANQNKLIIRMAGGANVLMTSGLKNAFDIGARNIDAAHRTFKRLNLHLLKEDVGGNMGRTVHLYVADGRMTVRTVGSTNRDL